MQNKKLTPNSTFKQPWRFLGVAIASLLLVQAGLAEKKASPDNLKRKEEIKAKSPATMPGYDPFVFRKISEIELRLHVVKPDHWQAADQRPCLIFFFGGGWENGNPKGSLQWTKWAAEQGMVGVAPDYRTGAQYGGTIEDCISDGRAAMIWVQIHAKELGIDPAKIICAGASAGGHLAAWTAITHKGPGRDDPGWPQPQPAALVLLCPATDTTLTGSAGARRKLGDSQERGLACSVTAQIPAKMPPTLIFHGTDDSAVPYANSKALHDKLIATENRCELITFEGGKHMYWTAGAGPRSQDDKKRTEQEVTSFLASLGLLK